MRIYVVTGMHVDFDNKLYNLFEPIVTGSREEAQAAVDEYCDGAIGDCEETEIGHDGFSRDIVFSDHNGDLTVVKARMQ